MRQLFIDLDGVLADFDGLHFSLFGCTPDRNNERSDFWEKIATHPTFFLDIPPMPDYQELWEGACRLHPSPIILTGGTTKVFDTPKQKRAWVDKHLGAEVTVVCCHSKDKWKHGKPGDILVDDWEKYIRCWEGMGGEFVLHESAALSLETLEGILEG